MNKSYTRINWENYPSEATPMNDTNMNAMDYALDIVDNRVIGLDTTKLDKTTANELVKTVSYDNTSGVFTVTYLNGSTATLDTKLEKLAVNFSYDSENERLVITLDDGTEQYVDLSSLITEYEFDNTSTISFVVENGKVKANINNGSVTGDMLQPNYLADITVQTGIAQQGAVNAGISATAAEAAAIRAEDAAERAETIVDIGFATVDKAGIVKPDGVTTMTDGNGVISVIGGVGGGAWDDITDKPFGTVGTDGLMVDGGVVDVDFSKVQEVLVDATTSVSGKMSAEDKTKLNGIEPGANNVSITDNLLATVPGTALDATMGKVLDDKVAAINSKLNYAHGTISAGDKASGVVTTNTIQLSEPLQSSNYIVVINGVSPRFGFSVTAKTVNGFNITSINNTNAAGELSYTWAVIPLGY